MQLLLQGWLAVAWGHSPAFLGIFLAARLIPKILLTVPAGTICDRFSRPSILIAARAGYAVASLVPLVGLLAPGAIVWLLAGVALAGAIHAFDLSSSGAMFGDVVDRDDIDAAVALNRAGSHVAALTGPVVAFVLISGVGSAAALAVSAGIIAASALAALPLLGIKQSAREERAGVGAAAGLFRYLRESPMTGVLILVGIAPAFIDKGVALLMPSIARGGGTVSLALIAPEVGALAMASLLALAPIRLGMKALIATAVLYAVFLSVASVRSHEAEALLLALGLAGMASAALGTASQAWLQRLVPVEMRGRVFAL
jgi:MFS family permease